MFKSSIDVIESHLVVVYFEKGDNKMQNFIDWANTNSGFIMILLTAIYVVATIVMASLMAIANRLSNKNIQQAIVLEKARLRPYVVLNLYTDKGIPYLILKNFGKTPAYNIYISTNPKIVRKNINHQEHQSIKMIDNKIGCLHPDQTMKDIAGDLNDLINDYPENIEVNLKYHDINDFCFDEKYYVTARNLDFISIRKQTRRI